MSNTKVEKEIKIEKKTKQTSLVADLDLFKSSEIEFLNWNSVGLNETFIIQLIEIEDKFAIAKVAFDKKPTVERKIALSSSLKNQLKQFNAVVGDVFAIIYLGKKESTLSAQMYHSFVVKKKVGTKFLTTKQFINALEEEYQKEL